MTDTEALWRGEFGDEYTDRNRIAMQGRESMLGATAHVLVHSHVPIESALEVGANRGLNLEVIARYWPWIELFACEPNDKARIECRRSLELDDKHLTADTADKLSFASNCVDMVFTSGVLIHIPPDSLVRSMAEIHRCAKKVIVCAEYFAPQEEEITYRGRSGAMWRRDYGAMYLDLFSDLQCLGCTFLWKRTSGADNLTLWIFEKLQKQANVPMESTRH